MRSHTLPRRSRTIAAVLAMLSFVPFAGTGTSIRAAPLEPWEARGSPSPMVEAEVLAALQESGSAEVVITLRDGAALDAPDSEMAAKVAAAQGEVISSLGSRDFRLLSRPVLLPVLSGVVTAEGLDTLQQHPRVAAIEFNDLYEPLLAEAVPAVKADLVGSVYGITGKDVTVAVLDTGIDNSHPDFEGKIVAQHCYAAGTRSCAPTGLAESDNAQDEYGHGTAVSGIILSPGKVSEPGVAPGANLVAVRVFKDSGQAANADILSGLDFVMRKRTEHDIRIVNMSLGGGGGRGVNCDAQNPAMKQAFQRLVAREIIIFVATGNDGDTDSVSAPACISNSVAVGATYDTEAATGGHRCPRQTNVTPLTIACFTNRGRAMDLLAPGIFISSSRLGGGVTKPGAGTSYAAPMAAGVAALVLEADPDLRAPEIERVLDRTGREIQHPEDEHVDFPLVDAYAAVQSLLPYTPTPSATPTPEPVTATATQPPPTETTTVAATATSDLIVTQEPTHSHIFLPIMGRRWFH